MREGGELCVPRARADATVLVGELDDPSPADSSSQNGATVASVSSFKLTAQESVAVSSNAVTLN